MNKLETSVGPLRLSNPVMPASGCFGPELGTLIDLNRLGALVTKTVFARPRSGNPAHRLHETEAGMLNSVGIPSRGLEFFINETLPEYRRFEPPTIVSIGGLSVADFWDIAERLRDIPGIAALEVNISCPNLEAGGLEIGGNPKTVEAVIRGVVDRSNVPTIAKLTPNVTSIAEIARAAEAGGAAALSAINTLVGLAVDLSRSCLSLGSGVGGLSGPAIKPIALRMVWEVCNAVDIPVIAVGGIASAADALEFLAVGAKAVQVGTATFTRPDAMIRIIDGIETYLVGHGNGSIQEFIGSVRTDPRSVESDVVGVGG